MFGKKKNVQAAESEVSGVQGAEETAKAEAPAQISASELKEFEEFKRQKKLTELRRLLRTIDHTLLKQTATRADIKKLCDEAREFGFYSVCVQPVYVSACRDFLRNSPAVKIACVVGFPMGENLTATKVYETKCAVRDGADEIDMVICVSAVKNGNYSYVKKEIRQVVKAAKGNPAKVILYTSLSARDEMLRAAACARDAGAAFVKTSTGYFGEGAKAEDVKLLKSTVGQACGVKASGGIRTAEQFQEMIDAGADRIGTSAGKEIAGALQNQMKQ